MQERDAEQGPIVIADPDASEWDDASDVVVVGYGGAGANAALQSREEGADVIVIDRFGGGGATHYSGGIIYAGCTKYQREAGFEDTPERMYDYLVTEVGDVMRPETLRRFCEQSNADIEWLTKHGVQFSSAAYLSKTAFPPEGKFLYYPGNETHPRNTAKTPAIPRGHRAVGKGYTGKDYFAKLSDAVSRAGVRVRRHEQAIRPVVDTAGRVIGLEVNSMPESVRREHQRLYEKANPQQLFHNKKVERAVVEMRALEEKHGRRLRIRARSGVILATGAFCFDADMVAEADPTYGKYYRYLHRFAVPGNDSSGIAFARALGGATAHLDTFYLGRIISPPEAFIQGTIVNNKGERFVNEDAYASKLGLAIIRQPDGEAWLILPAGGLRRALRQSIFTSWSMIKNFGLFAVITILFGGNKRAGDLRTLAEKCGIDADGLERTVREHDEALEVGLPDAVGKLDDYRTPLGDGPYSAVRMSIDNPVAFNPFLTLGGLTVDEETGMVTRADGSGIEGLYAAGLCAVGLHSAGYISGLGLADGVFSGRRAARSIAARMK